MLIGLLNTGLPQTFDLKKKMAYLWDAIKQSEIKWDMPIIGDFIEAGPKETYNRG